MQAVLTRESEANVTMQGLQQIIILPAWSKKEHLKALQRIAEVPA